LVQEISPKELNDWLGRTEALIIVDVRQPWEYKLCHIAESLNIPLGILPDQIDTIPEGKKIVTICHHGVRSKQAAIMLSQFGGFTEVFSLQGGLDAWAQEIDPSMERY
jgi:rhodanese-related sulfurtransferase